MPCRHQWDVGRGLQRLGEPTLVKIVRELVETVKKNVAIDWTVRENVRAQLRVIVTRIRRKYGYPPDKQEKATQTVLEPLNRAHRAIRECGPHVTTQ